MHLADAFIQSDFIQAIYFISVWRNEEITIYIESINVLTTVY